MSAKRLDAKPLSGIVASRDKGDVFLFRELHDVFTHFSCDKSVHLLAHSLVDILLRATGNDTNAFNTLRTKGKDQGFVAIKVLDLFKKLRTTHAAIGQHAGKTNY